MNTSDEEYDIEDNLDENTQVEDTQEVKQEDTICKIDSINTLENEDTEIDSESCKPMDDVYTTYTSWIGFIKTEVYLILNEVCIESNIPLFMFLNGIACGGLFGPSIAAFACIIGICILADIHELGKSKISFILCLIYMWFFLGTLLDILPNSTIGYAELGYNLQKCCTTRYLDPYSAAMIACSLNFIMCEESYLNVCIIIINRCVCAFKYSQFNSI